MFTDTCVLWICVAFEFFLCAFFFYGLCLDELFCVWFVFALSFQDLMRNRRSSASSSAWSDSPASTARASDCALVNHPPRRLLGRVAPGSYKSPTRFLAGSVALPASAPGSCKLPTRSLAGGGLGGGCGPGGRMLGAGFDVMVPNRRGGTILTALKASTDVPVLHCGFSIGAARALPIGKL